MVIYLIYTYRCMSFSCDFMPCVFCVSSSICLHSYRFHLCVLFHLTSSASIKHTNIFAEKSQLGSIKYGIWSTETHTCMRAHIHCCLFNVSSKPSTNSIYTDKTLSQIDYLLHTILSFTVKSWHSATSSHCFLVH